MTYQVKESTATLLPCILTDDTDFQTPELGVLFGAVTVNFAKEGDVGMTAKVMGAGNWTEIGDGVYFISFTAAELDTDGKFTYTVIAAGVSLYYYGLAQISTLLKDDIPDAVWTTPVPGAFPVGSAGEELASILDNLDNRLVINTVLSTLDLYDDAGIGVIKRWPLTDKAAGPVSLANLPTTLPKDRGTRTI